MPALRRSLHRLIPLAALPLALAACSEDAPVTSPPTPTVGDGAESTPSRSIVATVNCKADVAAGALTCGEVPVVDGESGAQRATLGGQNQYVLLRSFNPGYNPGTQIFEARVDVGNLIPQGLGSPDGYNVTGIRVFHHTGPTVTVGTGGPVTVANADGTGTFTGSNQPYFEYPYYLPPPQLPLVYVTPTKVWQWNVPATVTTFVFSVFVEADVVGENGYVDMSPRAAAIPLGGTQTVAGTPMDVVGRSVPGTVTYSSSDPSIADVDPNTGLVTAYGYGVVDIIGSTGGPEADGVTRITVPSTSGFDIELNFLTSATASQRLAFQNAAAKWGSLITGDLPTEQVTIPLLGCGGAVDEYADDVNIRVVLGPIDGPGGTLGAAAPCWMRAVYRGLPAFGVMIFDTDDLDALETAGQLTDVITHEMGHVLGIGSLWQDFNLFEDNYGPLSTCPAEAALQDPFFSGTQAQAVFASLGTGGYTGNTVPVENLYGDGTRCVHWRESVLDTELMTGFAEASGTAMPLSELTVKSLADMGYTVAVSGWDAFTCPACAPPAPGVAAVEAHTGGVLLMNDVLSLPLYSRDASGRVIEVRPGKLDQLPIRR